MDLAYKVVVVVVIAIKCSNVEEEYIFQNEMVKKTTHYKKKISYRLRLTGWIEYSLCFCYIICDWYKIWMFEESTTNIFDK